MSWEKVDDKMKRKKDGDYVSCQEKYELQYIKDAIKEAFPGKFTDAVIDSALQACCKAVDTPRPRAKFLECLKKKLL